MRFAEWPEHNGAGSSRRALRALLSVFLIAGGGLSANAATIRHDRSDADYLNLAALPEYASVGTFVNSWGFTGSGVLIAPDWILTGAHMFAAATSGTFTINGTSYGTSQLIGHPSWNSANVFAGYDFGLARLSTPVGGVTPATLYTGSSEFGQVGTFVGFGITGTGLTGYQPPADGLKRAFQNIIDGDFGTPSVLLGADFDNSLSPVDNIFGGPEPQNLEGAVAPGDSGGGVFLTFGPVTYLAGVVSFAAQIDGLNNSDYGDVSGFGRVSSVFPWIVSVTSIPEPSSVAFFTLGLAIVLWRLLLFRSRRGSSFRPSAPCGNVGP